MINDTQFDFYGVRLATCDSSGTIKICRMIDDEIDGNSIVFLVDNEISHS